MKYFYEKYQSWLFKDREINLLTYKSNIISLFKQANISDSYIPTVTPMGYGQLASFKASVMQNFPSAREDFALIISRMFNEAIGIYRTRIFETFSPIYWINCLIFLPKKSFGYLGLSQESIIIKVLQCFWWISTPIIIAFRTKITDYVLSLLNL